MTQHDQTPPAASYAFVVTVDLDGTRGPLTIAAESVNELRKAVRNLVAAGMIAEAPAAAASPSGTARCPIHGRELKPSQRRGMLYCPARDDDGSYCKHKARV